MTTVNHTRPSGSSRISSVLMGVISAIVAWNDQRVTRKCLSRLTDHELDDIGLVRSDIASM